MCTALFDSKYGSFFARTLDLEESYGEKITQMSRGDIHNFIRMGKVTCKYSIVGMALRTESLPLFFDGVNEKGLCAAALNFPLYAKYKEPGGESVAIASFEVIPYILSQCGNVGEALDILDNATVTPDDFSKTLKSTSLHWMIADSERATVIESTADGLKIYDDPFGVMTNSPPFPYHTARISEYSYLSPEQQKNNILPSQELSIYSRGLGAFGLPGDYSSSSRFIRALFAKEHTLLPFDEDETEDTSAAKRRIFDILGTVSLPYGIARTETGRPIYTVYTSCIDIENREYSYFTATDRIIKTFKAASV